MTRLRRWRALGVLLVLAVACGGPGTTADTDTTAAETTTTQDQAATTAAETTTTTEATTTTAAVTGSLVLGIEAPWSVTYLPAALTVDRMLEMGYEVEVVQFESGETMTQALADGQIDVGSTSAGTVLAAVDAGLDVKAFLGLAANNFVMVSRAEFQTCESLDGQRVGIHSFEGTTGTLTQVWFETECPEAQPDLQVIPGSENRFAALLANQLDASAVDIPSAIQLEAERPGEFVVIDSFAELDVVASYFYATTAWLTSNEQLARDFATIYTEMVNEIYQDPSIAIGKAAELIPEIDTETMEEIVQRWVDQQIWNPVAGLGEERVQFTLDFYRRNNDYPNVAGPSDLVTAEYAPSG